MTTGRIYLICGLLLLARAVCAVQAPAYLWFEPEWFAGVQGKFRYWPGTMTQPLGHWAIAGPGISAEFSQGGESEWNSISVPAEETNAVCTRELIVPRAGTYRLWVRYVDHRLKNEPFSVRVEQEGKAVVAGEFGIKPAVPVNDEYMLYWDFSFGWDKCDGRLAAGPATLRVIIDKPGDAWRQVDAILLTDDLDYTPVAREKPRFAYMDTIRLQPENGAAWRGSGKSLRAGESWTRGTVEGRDFTLWARIKPDKGWWAAQHLPTLTRYDLFFQFAPPHDITAAFHKQFAGRKDVPIMSWPSLIPGFHLGDMPDLSPESPVRQWLEQTKTPFYISTNYATKLYDEKIGPATYQALTGPLAGQFLGFIHGEAMTTAGPPRVKEALGPDRRAHLEAFAAYLRRGQAEDWSKKFRTPVAEAIWSKGIPCLSVDSIALAHFFQDSGVKTLGYELDATNAHAPMRVAFERGAARQYGGNWINYASSNFGDACNYFTQKPVVPRGAPGWFHSKYAVTDGVNISWYRKMYYLNYLGGALAIYWEQSLTNQWILPGPGTHPIDLSPLGRATVEFQEFVDRVPDRGEPYTPVAFLLNYAHGYEPVNYSCKALEFFPENAADRELRELFTVAWHPAEVTASQPISPDAQSLASGVYGNIFDMLIDKPERARALLSYPVIWAAGDVELGGKMKSSLEDYVRKGGTLVVNVNAARGTLPASLLGVTFTGKRHTATQWMPAGQSPLACVPYEVEVVKPARQTKVLAFAAPETPLITRTAVGNGAVILTLVPGMLGLDERAHPALPYLMNGVTQRLLPVEVLLADGQRPVGGLMYQVNKTKNGWLVMLMNNQGVDKTQSGIARVDRRAYLDLVLRPNMPVISAREYTQPRSLEIHNGNLGTEVRIRVEPGDVQVVELAIR